MQNVFLKPAVPGAIVRDQHSFAPLKPEGEWKPLSSYWARRIRDLDVIPVEEVAAAAPPSAISEEPVAEERRSPRRAPFPES